MTSQIADAAADAAEALPATEPALEPIEVELPPENPEPAPAAKVEEKPPEPVIKRPGRPINERIQTLVNDKSTLMQQLDEERRRSAQLAESLQAREQELSGAQLRQMELHKARLTSDAERARQEYEQAYREQDPKKQADATAKLARTESGLADVEAWEARAQAAPQPQAKPQPQAQPQPQQRPAPPPVLEPETASWIEQNPWFQMSVNGQRNPEFDQSMHLTAVAYSSRLEEKLRREGRTDEIGSPEYFAEIDQHMAKEFPERYEQAEETPVVQTTRVGSPVAPATRSQPNTTGKANGGKVLAQLSGEQRAIADSLRSSGALVYSANHPKAQANPTLRGQRMSRDDAYIEYGIQIRRDKADQAQRRANQ